MERLTVMTDKGAALVMGGPYESEQAVRDDLMRRYKVAVDRLAAYEDTGWTPEDISEKKAMLKERFVRLMSQELGMTQECLRDIVAAHLDGRLVVLPPPAKEGDPAPKCFYNEADNPWAWCLGMGKGPSDDEPSERCKECWYLETAHQEAEAAVERREENT